MSFTTDLALMKHVVEAAGDATFTKIEHASSLIGQPDFVEVFVEDVAKYETLVK